MLASEIMTTAPLTAREEMLLGEVANLFQDRYVTRLPVVRRRNSSALRQDGTSCTGMKASAYWSWGSVGTYRNLARACGAVSRV
ncbi:MAG: CBS domain-containing protein [Nitrospira sp.]|nr:CBS domain-containing protein [Nitrospira sp.]